MIKVFFDCEMTHLWDPIPEPPALISIGCISEDGQTFYAENEDYPFERCNAFVWETVIPLLEGGVFSMSYAMLAKQLKDWIEVFETPVQLWTDAPGADWPHVKTLFDIHGWPHNLMQSPMRLYFANANQDMRFQVAVEEGFAGIMPKLRRHHALDDAIANRHGYLKATEKRF